MIEFLSFFLVLVTGQIPVELAVAGPVAEVELRLDGRTLATLHGEPWSLLADLGPELVPRELTAIARDGTGRELDRVTQWINVGVQSSGATMSFATDPAGRPRSVGLEWESVGRRQPQSIEVDFDGEPLDVSDPQRVPFPPFDEDSLHFVSAVVRFSDRLVTRLDASFGGVYSDAVATELTAVPVVLEKGARMPKPEELGSLFVKDGRPLPVHGVEKTDAEVILVRDPASQPYFDSMTEGALRVHPAFDEHVRLYFLSPRPDLALPEVVSSEVFPHSPRFEADGDGLLYLITKHRPVSFPVHLADAVAVAGMTAQASHGRRAVVLVLGGEPQDESHYPAVQVREYLRRLRVPLYVWSMVSEAPRAEWGDVRFTGTPQRLVEAVAALNRDLAAQRIVWLEGQHLPQTIELAGDGHGLRLVDTAPPAEAPQAEAPTAADRSPVEPPPDADDGSGLIELFSEPDGLVAGPYEVELAAVGPVKDVEIRLDGRGIGAVSGEPWTFEADLGEDLAPHRLAALARDREGRELERAEQWINVAAPAGELTAVAVVVDRGVKLPAPEAMEGWFLADGTPVKVRGVQSGPAEVSILRDPSIQPQLDALAEFAVISTGPLVEQAAVRKLLEPGSLRASTVPEDLPPSQSLLVGKVMRRLHDFAGLGAETTVGFLSPMAAPVSRIGSERNLYNRSGPYTSHDGDVLGLAQRISVSSAHRFSDAVAVAAMEIHASGRRRAVVALVGGGRPDESLFTAVQVRSYLRALQVPLFIWSAAPAPPRPDSEWGEVRWVNSRSKKLRLANLETAAAELRRYLESERIVYLSGRHLPQSIALTERAAGLRLAGREPGEEITP